MTTTIRKVVESISDQIRLALGYYISTKQILIIENADGNVCTSHCIGLKKLDLSECPEATGTKDVTDEILSKADSAFSRFILKCRACDSFNMSFNEWKMKLKIYQGVV